MKSYAQTGLAAVLWFVDSVSVLVTSAARIAIAKSYFVSHVS